ncbi:putative inactive receptor kinase [Trifolium pratense]|uniref:Putative inactive receptor kinase n=1 Tax=Trifolium pratense TaxID=57577 RepID=A0A2K3M448_TRIPR|nr:putative inactive receptor kinase [Trifolium pratense]
MKLKETVLFFLIAFLIAIVSGADLASDREVLIKLRASVGGRTLFWNTTETEPCLWTGVTCDNKRVTALRLPAMGLTGDLPLGLGNLTELQTLSLRFNALTGEIPSDFGNLVNLRNLYLHGKNNFSGEVSEKFNKLTRLDTLFLEQNRFTGSVPDLNVPPLHQFNVSFNNLTGSIPKRFSHLDISAFSGNSLCGNPLQVTCPGNSNKKGLSGGAIAGIKKKKK